jgi:hypothetical protein
MASVLDNLNSMKVVERKDSHMKLKGDPENVLNSLMALIDVIAEDKYVSEFYIGCTNDWNEAQNRHGCDNIFLIYETNIPEHSVTVEDILIKTFKENPKNNNDTKYSGWNVLKGYPIYVYVAIWYKKSEKSLSVEHIPSK